MVKIVTSVGYPAAGKSIVADWMNNNGIPVVSMGDRLRERFNRVDESDLDEMFKEDDKSSLLGNWATKQREMHGEDIVAKWTCEHITKNFGEDVIFIDGLRSKPELERFEEHFDEVNVIFIKADKTTRLQRIKNRGREGESDFTMEDLEKRDQREDGWGLKEVTEEADYEIENNGTITGFHEKIENTFSEIQS